MSGILILNDLNKGSTLKQGDKTQLEYQLADGDGDALSLIGKTATVRLISPDYQSIGYEKTGVAIGTDNIVRFTIDDIIPARKYFVEIIADGKYIFPSVDDGRILNIDKSSLGIDANIIEIIGVDQVVQKVLDKVDDAFLENIEGTINANEQIRISNENARKTAESSRVSAESSRVSAENARKTAETNRASAESTRVSQENTRQAWYNNNKDSFLKVYSTNIGNNSSKLFTITHNLNSTNVITQVFLNNEQLLPAMIKILNNNQVQIEFASVWGTNQLKAVVMG